MAKKGWRIALSTAKAVFGVVGIGAASIGLVACFSPIDWPLGLLLVLTGSAIFSVAGGILQKKLYLFIIPATAIAGCYPFLLPLPWVAVKWAERHYRFKTGRTPAP